MSEKITPFSNVVIGIDLGTTNSLVAHVRDGKPEVLNSREGQRLIPSVVSFVDDKPVVGYAAKRKKVRDAEFTVFSVKRLLGRGFEDVAVGQDVLPYEIVRGGPEGDSKNISIRVGERTYTAIEISAIILRELKASAEQALGVPVRQAVITVPAYFNDSQRQATRTAGHIAGLEVLRIINEPTAAALAYGLDRKKEGLIAVYDMGGGTFDVSILKLHDGIFEVLATNGNTTLGGDDLDQAVLKVVAQEIKESHGLDPARDIQLNAALIEAAEKMKIELSQSETAVFEVKLACLNYSRKWTRSEFQKLILPIIEKTREPCLQALRDAGLKPEDLSDVVMVGGPTRLKIVQDVARMIFGREPNTSVHPDEVVAAGAAIQADILAGNNQDLLLLDVVPLSLGLETYGGLMSPLIARNTRIPTAAREVFTTFVDRQTGVDIHVLQGEREKVEDNRSLARFKLAGIEPLPAGLPRIEVMFLIDADGILQVAAKDLRTGHEQTIEVRPSYGLSDAEVEKMLVEGQKNAEADLAYRRWVEVRNEAEPMLRNAEKKLPDAFRLLPREEAQTIEAQVLALKQGIEQKDIAQVQDAKYRLGASTVRLAELLIKEAIESAQRASNKI
ncbi:MAG: molecular chaperone DnaK [Methylotenera sp.]|nr:molecular chaperone DnaK [Oligoflexia bacterium]